MTPDPLLIERLALALIDRLEALPPATADSALANGAIGADRGPAGTPSSHAAQPVPGPAAAAFDHALDAGRHDGGSAAAAGWPQPRQPQQQPPRRGRVVLVSSARAGEGKSFVAGLLHAALSSQPAYADSVALLDSQQLVGAPTASRTPPVASATRLFQPAAVREALAVLRQRHAVALVDGVSLADCGALAREADAVVLVVDARRTPRRSIERALAAARIDPARLAGVVLNRREPGLPGWLGAD